MQCRNTQLILQVLREPRHPCHVKIRTSQFIGFSLVSLSLIFSPSQGPSESQGTPFPAGHMREGIPLLRQLWPFYHFKSGPSPAQWPHFFLSPVLVIDLSVSLPENVRSSDLKGLRKQYVKPDAKAHHTHTHTHTHTQASGFFLCGFHISPTVLVCSWNKVISVQLLGSM